jgi:hypothetical protein
MTDDKKVTQEAINESDALFEALPKEAQEELSNNKGEDE